MNDGTPVNVESSGNTTVKKSSGKKILIILMILLLVMLGCCGLSVAGFTILFKEVAEQSKDINKTVIVQLCESTDPSDYEDFFTESFLETYTLTEIDELLTEAYAGVDDCSSLGFNGFLDMLSSGQSASIEVVNGRTTAQYTFLNGNDDIVTLELLLEDGEWLIDGMSVSEVF